MCKSIFDEVRVFRESVIAQDEGRSGKLYDLHAHAISRICCILNDSENYFGYIEWLLLVDDAYAILKSASNYSHSDQIVGNLTCDFKNELLYAIRTAQFNSAKNSLEFVAQTYDMLRVGTYKALRVNTDDRQAELTMLSKVMLYQVFFFKELNCPMGIANNDPLHDRVGNALENLLVSKQLHSGGQLPTYDLWTDVVQTLGRCLGPEYSNCYNERYDRVLSLIKLRLRQLDKEYKGDFRHFDRPDGFEPI